MAETDPTASAGDLHGAERSPLEEEVVDGSNAEARLSRDVPGDHRRDDRLFGWRRSERRVGDDRCGVHADTDRGTIRHRGRRNPMWVQCQDAGAPTIVLEAGSDSQGSTDFPAELIDDLAATNRTCIYDRPGTGMSGRPGDDERTVDDVNRLLRSVLTAADVPGPYVLAGNSGGGILSMEFARRYRDEMAGLVLLDVPGPQRDLDPTLQGVSLKPTPRTWIGSSSSTGWR